MKRVESRHSPWAGKLEVSKFSQTCFLDIGQNLIASVSGLLGTCHLYLSISLLLSKAGGSGEQLVSHELVRKDWREFRTMRRLDHLMNKLYRPEDRNICL